MLASLDHPGIVSVLHVWLVVLGNLEWDSMEESRQEREKCLLHVAATRTKNSLLVTRSKSLTT